VVSTRRARDYPVMDIVPNKALSLSLSLSRPRPGPGLPAGRVSAAPPPPPDLGLRSGFDPPDLDRPGRLPHQQGLCEARLGCRDGSPQLGASSSSSPTSLLTTSPQAPPRQLHQQGLCGAKPDKRH